MFLFIFFTQVKYTTEKYTQPKYKAQYIFTN